jgi:DNA invertase Pin-like site-specific DNA recombinase
MTTKHIGQLVGYIRVSTLDQNIGRQEEQLAGHQPHRIFTDKASGKSMDRPELKRCLDHLREGDTLIVHSMDRLARNLDDLRGIVKGLTDKGVAVQFIKESMTFTGEENAMSQLMLSIMGAFAEFERSLIKERQREGIAIAKTKGVYAGRKNALSEDKITELVAEDKANAGRGRSALADKYGIARETLYKYIRAAETSPAQETQA